MVNRPLYLKKLMTFKNQPLIKVITGMRRTGKSTLLLLFADALRAQGVSEDHIIRLNLEDLENEPLQDYHKLYQHLKEAMQGKEHVYLLLDEIQAVDGWEKVVNTFYENGAADIYITGSNAKMLSSELSTLLSGRYVEITVYPLSFQEYLDFLPPARRTPVDAAFSAYLKYGGFPVIPGLPQTNDTIGIVLSGIYHTALVKDIAQRNAVRDAQLLEHLSSFLADSIGNPIATSRISSYLTSQGRKVSGTTIDNYLRMLAEAFVFYPAQRYDIKGKAYLKTQEKYYIVDTGIRNALLGFRPGDYSHILENIVYLELLRRGFHVSIGKLGALEVDFIAERMDERIYYQVSASALDEHTLERELRPLMSIPDQYDKVLLTMDRTYVRNYEGVKNVNIVDFLLER